MRSTTSESRLRATASIRDAAAAYERVIRDYPSSNILPEAWYKVGISYDRLGQPDKAREAFESVVKNYPDQRCWPNREAEPGSFEPTDALTTRAHRKGGLRWAA